MIPLLPVAGPVFLSHLEFGPVPEPPAPSASAKEQDLFRWLESVAEQQYHGTVQQEDSNIVVDEVQSTGPSRSWSPDSSYQTVPSEESSRESPVLVPLSFFLVWSCSVGSHSFYFVV